MALESNAPRTSKKSHICGACWKPLITLQGDAHTTQKSFPARQALEFPYDTSAGARTDDAQSGHGDVVAPRPGGRLELQLRKCPGRFQVRCCSSAVTSSITVTENWPRLTDRSSSVGQLFDTTVDWLVHTAMFVGLGVGSAGHGIQTGSCGWDWSARSAPPSTPCLRLDATGMRSKLVMNQCRTSRSKNRRQPACGIVLSMCFASCPARTSVL